MKRPILIVGSSNADMIIRVPSLPAKGETVTDGTFMQTYGGKGANQAVAVARAGGHGIFIACLGRDPTGDAMMNNFKKDGLDVQQVVRTDKAPSGAALIMFDERGDNYLAVAPGANYRLSSAHMTALEDRIAESSMLVMQMEIPAATTLRALQIADRKGVPVLFNYAPAQNVNVPVSKRMTGLVVNEVEAEALSGCPARTRREATSAARTLRSRGPRFVIITMGKQGALVCDEEGEHFIPSYSVKVVDTTAAGDTYCGALAVSLVEGRTLCEAARFAAAAAALSVMQMGAQPSIPRRSAIDTFLKKNNKARTAHL